VHFTTINEELDCSEYSTDELYCLQCFRLLSINLNESNQTVILSFKGGGDKDILREFLGGWEENIDFWYQKMY